MELETPKSKNVPTNCWSRLGHVLLSDKLGLALLVSDTLRLELLF